MYSNSFTEDDWKLFKKKIPQWQEAYMAKLNEGYVELLTSNKEASEKFWELEKQIAIDKKSVGVVATVKRSMLVFNLTDLLADGVIIRDDLCDFSDTLQNAVLSLQKFRE